MDYSGTLNTMRIRFQCKQDKKKQPDHAREGCPSREEKDAVSQQINANLWNLLCKLAARTTFRLQ